MLALLSSPVRLRILQLAWEKECSAGDLAAKFDMTFGAVSQHLALLREAGALKMRKDGRSRLYRADHAALGPLTPALEAMWADKLGMLKTLAEQEQRTLNRSKTARPAGGPPPRRRSHR